MATLAHSRIISPPLDSSIPTPFPREQLTLELSKGKGVDKVINPFEVQQDEGSTENPFENGSTLAGNGIATPNTYTLVYNIDFFAFVSYSNVIR